MNRLVIIGNGFDLAHGLKTSYKDFIDWYWEQRFNALCFENTSISKDCLCTLKIIAKNNSGWRSFLYCDDLYDKFARKWKYTTQTEINKIILITSVGMDLSGKKFVEIARKILGFDVVVLFFSSNRSNK